MSSPQRRDGRLVRNALRNDMLLARGRRSAWSSTRTVGMHGSDTFTRRDWACRHGMLAHARGEVALHCGGRVTITAFVIARKRKEEKERGENSNWIL